MRYCVRISCIQYGNAYIDARNLEEAEEKARKLYCQRSIDWYEEEISDMTVEEDIR